MRMSRRRMAAQPRVYDAHSDGQDYITNLPTETLTQIVQYFDVKHGIHWAHDRESFKTLANIARVSRRFYQIAMSFLWNTVEIRPSKTVPHSLLMFPGITSRRALSYIRSMSLSICPGSEEIDKIELNRLRKYTSKCLRVLTAAGSIHHLELYVHIFDTDKYSPGFGNEIKAINVLIFRILEHVKKMNLRNLKFSLGKKTAGVNELLRVIEGKVNVLKIRTMSLDNWVDRLSNHQRLKRIIISCIRDDASDSPNLTTNHDKFWIALSQLRNITEATVDDIPISPTLNLQFPHLLHLDLFIWNPRSGLQLAGIFCTILKQMPNLEVLIFGSRNRTGFEREIDDVDIEDITCRNLRQVSISPYFPKSLVKTIAKHNPNLMHCDFDGHMTNLDDEDIRHLSQCRYLHTIELRSPTGITDGLAYLTNLPQLNSLSLHYSMGKYMSTQLLLDISSSCQNLQEICVSDFPGSPLLRARPFEEQEMPEIFLAGVEMLPYIEPSYAMDYLYDYTIRLDKLRNDQSFSTRP